MKSFTPWEDATDVATSARPGVLPRATLWPLTLFTALALTLLLWPVLGAAAIPTAMVFGRLLALDLTTYTLPNIYTVPLLAMGLAYAATHGLLWQAVLAMILITLFAEVLRRSGKNVGMGGGDLKLLAAMCAFLPLTSVFFAVAVGSLLWMPIAFAKPKLSVPFGVPLVLGWSLFLRWPLLGEHLSNALFSTIS